MLSPSLARLASVALLAAAVWLGGSSGCSVYMAANQPARKNVSVLNPGTPRPLVIAELGEPIHTERHDGTTVDLFSFTQGYSGGAKAGRAAFHLAADVFTAGLWEVVGTPAEAVFSGTDVKLEVTYGAGETVEKVRAFDGGNVVNATSGSGEAFPAPPPPPPVPAPAVAPAPASAPQAAADPAADGRSFRAKLASTANAPLAVEDTPRP